MLQDLSPILRRYFSSTADNRDPAIYGKAYVPTDETTEYDKVLESLLKDWITPRLNPMAQEIEPMRRGEPKLSKAIAEFDVERPREGQVQLITGRIGAGKSLFIRRYIRNYYSLPRSKRSVTGLLSISTLALPASDPLRFGVQARR